MNIDIFSIDMARKAILYKKYDYILSVVSIDEVQTYPKQINTPHHFIEVWDVDYKPYIFGEYIDLTPTVEIVEQLIISLYEIVKRSQSKKDFNLLIHCYGGHGRSCATAVLLYQILGLSESDAENKVKNSVDLYKPNNLILQYGRNILDKGYIDNEK